MKRFSEQGMDGLKVAKGRGRRSVLQTKDLETVRRLVQSSRQRIGLIKDELENDLDKKFSQQVRHFPAPPEMPPLRSFLKKTVAVSNALGG